MTDDIVRRLEAWARDTEQSWSDVPTPTPDQPGHEWYVADAAEVAMAREAAGEIGRLRQELAQTQDERRHAVAALSEQVDTVRAERDEATRLLHAMVEHIYEITPTDKNPKHTCDFDHRPERGACKFCENWTAANVLLYGEEYGKGNDND